MATLEARLLALEAAQPDDYSHKPSILVSDDTTDQEIQQALREFCTEVYRVSADPFAHSFLG